MNLCNSQVHSHQNKLSFLFFADKLQIKETTKITHKGRFIYKLGTRDTFHTYFVGAILSLTVGVWEVLLLQPYQEVGKSFSVLRENAFDWRQYCSQCGLTFIYYSDC